MQASAVEHAQRDDNTLTAADLISAYEQGVEELRLAVAGMAGEQLRSSPVAGKWSTRSCEHPFTITKAPSCAKREAMAKPMPAVEPVTSAFLFVSCKSIVVSFSSSEETNDPHHQAQNYAHQLLSLP
jgi:hypothetical protein